MVCWRNGTLKSANREIVQGHPGTPCFTHVHGICTLGELGPWTWLEATKDQNDERHLGRRSFGAGLHFKSGKFVIQLVLHRDSLGLPWHDKLNHGLCPNQRSKNVGGWCFERWKQARKIEKNIQNNQSTIFQTFQQKLASCLTVPIGSVCMPY